MVAATLSTSSALVMPAYLLQERTTVQWLPILGGYSVGGYARPEWLSSRLLDGLTRREGPLGVTGQSQRAPARRGEWRIPPCNIGSPRFGSPEPRANPHAGPS